MPVEGSIVVGKVAEKTGNFGFDTQMEEYVDLVAAGIVDPNKGGAHYLAESCLVA